MTIDTTETAQKQSNFVELLSLRARQQGDDTAYIFLPEGESGQESRLSYAELARRAQALAVRLRQNHPPGSRVLLLYPPGLDYIVAFYACLAAGMVAVPTYPPRRNRPDARLRSIVQDSQACVALTDAAIYHSLESRLDNEPTLKHLVWLQSANLDLQLAEDWRAPRIQPDDLAFLQYTSGSTGAPKGVMVSHANLIHNSRLSGERLLSQDSRCFVAWLPPYHDMGLIGAILYPMFHRLVSVLMPPAAFLQKPLRWLQAISHYRGNQSAAPNFAYELCAQKIGPEQRAGLDLSCWNMALNGAEPVRAETLAAFAEAFRDCGFQAESLLPAYGMAETTLMVSGKPNAQPTRLLSVSSAALQQGRIVVQPASADSQTLVSCGPPGIDTELRIVDPQSGLPCAADAVGEVWIRGPSVAQGYWRQTELSAAVFQARLADSGDGPYLRTGDLGFLHQGELYITGRHKDLIIIRGRNYYPQDLEHSVEQCHPLLHPAGAAVFTVDQGEGEQLVVACEVERRYLTRRQADNAAPGAERHWPHPDRRQAATEFYTAPAPVPLVPQEVMQAVRAAVAREHALPVHTVLLLRPGALPKTSSGKVQRHACRQAYLEHRLECIDRDSRADAGQPLEWLSLSPERLLALPSEQRQSALADYLHWQLAQSLGLPLERIDRGEAVNAHGLDSLQTANLQYRLETDLGLEWPPARLDSELTIEQLAAVAAADLAALNTAAPTAAATIDPEAAAPLSYNQQALWFLYRLAPTSAAYNVSLAIKTQANPDAAALGRSLHRLTQRHPMLRSRYRQTEAGPRQWIAAEAELEFAELDARHWDPARIQQHLEQAAQRPFDLEHGPLARVLLLHCVDRHILLLNQHHICVDAWSMQILIDELNRVYQAELDATPPQLAPPVADYLDYVRWQRDLLAGPRGEAMWAYWRQQLAGELPVLNLPTDYPRPPQQSFAGADHHFNLSPELLQKLQTLGRKHRTSLFTVLLSAYQVLLHRYSGQEEVLVGTPVTGRSRADFTDIVGYFINTVVLRSRTDAEDSFRELLERNRKQMHDALAHQDYPFQHLVERLQPQRNPAHSPLIQTLFILQQPHRLKGSGGFILQDGVEQLPLGGMTWRSVPLASRDAQFDLSLMLSVTAQGLGARFDYCRALFKPETIARMAEHWRHLLESLCAHPEWELRRYPLLDLTERRRMLLEWNATEAAYPRDFNLGQWVESQAQRDPYAPAALWQGVRLSYIELEQRANQLARHLQDLGVGPDSRVALCLPRSLELLVAVLGVVKAGAAYVPLDPAYPRERLEYMLRDSAAEVVLGHPDTAAALPAGAYTRVDLIRDDNAISAQVTGPLRLLSNPDHLAYIIYTSGSTGQPKGVAMTRRALANLIHWQIQQGDAFLPGVKTVQFAPLSFDVSFQELFSTWASGGSLVLIDEATRLDSAALLETVEREHVGRLFLPFVALQQLAETALQRERLPHSLREIITAGEQLQITPALREFYRRLPQCRLVNQYGPSETHVVSAYTLEGPPQDWPQLPPIGKPIANTQLYILDPLQQPVPVGVSGELYLGGACLARGYWGQAELSAQKFLPMTLHKQQLTLNDSAQNPLLTDTCLFFRVYRSGDAARWRADGSIEFLGRLDQQIKLRGFRIEPGEIENHLRAHPGVQQAALSLQEPRPGDKRLVAYLVAQPGQTLETAALREFLRPRLPDYMLPAAYVLLDALPLTPSGKLDRKRLPVPDSFGVGAAQPIAPRTPLERELTEMWQELLRVASVGVEDNFFDLGGHSLLATQVLARIRTRYQVEIPVLELFEHPTVAALARLLERHGGARLEPTEKNYNQDREEGEL